MSNSIGGSIFYATTESCYYALTILLGFAFLAILALKYSERNLLLMKKEGNARLPGGCMGDICNPTNTKPTAHSFSVYNMNGSPSPGCSTDAASSGGDHLDRNKTSLSKYSSPPKFIQGIRLVQLDEHCRQKYVLIQCEYPGSKGPSSSSSDFSMPSSSEIQKHYFVRGAKSARYHRMAAEPLVAELRQQGFQRIEIKGGGRIEHGNTSATDASVTDQDDSINHSGVSLEGKNDGDNNGSSLETHFFQPEKPLICVYGTSLQYGKADHLLTASILQHAFPDFKILWSNEGY